MALKLPKEKSSGEMDLSSIRLFVYGQPKIGKTSLCSGFPDALFLATEPGYHAHKVYALPINSWTEFIEAVDLILKGDHHHKTIVIDTADILASLCITHVCKKFNIEHMSEEDFGKGYDFLKKELERQLNRLFMSKYGVILTSHTQTQSIMKASSSISKVIPTLNKQARSVIMPKVDTIGLIRVKMFKLPDGTHVEKRVISFKASEFEESGDRTKKLPEEIILSINPAESYAQFAKYFRKEAGQKTVQQQKQEAAEAAVAAAAFEEKEDEEQSMAAAKEHPHGSAGAKKKVAPVRKAIPAKGGSKTMKKT